MEKAVTRAYEECVVHEAIVFHEGIESKDDFGYPQKENPQARAAKQSLHWGQSTPYNNTKEKEAEASSSDGHNDASPCDERITPDYTKQLQFHEHELAQAEQRGFPPGQVEYHAGKIAVLRLL